MLRFELSRERGSHGPISEAQHDCGHFRRAIHDRAWLQCRADQDMDSHLVSVDLLPLMSANDPKRTCMRGL